MFAEILLPCGLKNLREHRDHRAQWRAGVAGRPKPSGSTHRVSPWPLLTSGVRERGEGLRAADSQPRLGFIAKVLRRSLRSLRSLRV